MDKNDRTESSSTMGQLLATLKEAKARIEENERSKTEPIAIIGMGCRFPGGVDSPEAFWRLLANGQDAMGEIPVERWNVDRYYDPDPDTQGKIYTRAGSWLQEIDRFDAEFFRISPREATSLDPQQRLLLEVTWEALERAGQAPGQLAGSKTGVFIGIGQNDYARLRLYGNDPEAITAYDGTGNGLCFPAGRLSYFLGLQGPTLSIDTACSSSLVALHLACQSLRLQESELAIVGGVHLVLSPDITIFLSRTHALAADGRCKTFDRSADGFGRGEGCGVVILKRLSAAVKARDNILAVIRASAMNHDGASSGLTVPNGLSQQAVLRQTLKNARISPESVDYLEAHGTGTSLGDPIELRAIGSVFQDSHSHQRPLWVGSVKTNIGHLEAAAGIAGLIKVVLSLQHQQIPPHLHFHEPTPHINWSELPIAIPTTITPWPRSEHPRLAEFLRDEWYERARFGRGIFFGRNRFPSGATPRPSVDPLG
jgi:acyl transferase domain-containing protein